ncbi:PRD domain-containing protein [Bengtsoniella intestinalis]|uniref:BglG family transcription antiterminator n=1 Tax=Bengtsoniella intestinalis TaxID=3073143 RepID=UPI00391F9AF9
MAKTPQPLTPRQRDVVVRLAQFSAENPATVADISKELNISSRTVLRELPTIEQWLQGQQVAFIRKPGVGIALEGTLEQRQQVVAQLQTSNAQTDKPNRRRFITAQLLADQEPAKSYAFAKTYDISEGTLTTDLDYIQGWLGRHEVTLHRKTGLGLYVTGSENRLRQAMAALVYEWMQDGAVSRWFLWGNATGDSQSTHGLYVLGLLKQAGDLPAMRELLVQTAKDQGCEYTDQGFLSALVHLSIVVTRIRQNLYLTQIRELHQQTPAQARLAEAIATGMEANFHIILPESERSAIAAGMMGAMVTQNQDLLADVDLYRLVLKMIAVVETEAKVALQGDELLATDLVRHLQHTFQRLKLGVDTSYNTHGPELKKAYPAIYNATQEACKLLEAISGASRLGENETPLVAMHFCAAAERCKAKQAPMSVVVSCPMGMGSSRILVANLERAFPDIQVKGVVSTMAMQAQWLQEQGIDLVVSTVGLELNFPHICVSPMLTPQDIRQIQAFIDRWTPSEQVVTVEQGQNLKETLAYVEDLTQEITHVLSYLPLQIITQVDSKAQLLDHGAELFAIDATAKAQILADLTAREDICETYIDQGRTLLLHCKTSAVDHCHFGYLRLTQPLDSQTNQVHGAIVMVAPKEARQVHIEMMGHICSAFLDNQALYIAVQTGTAQDFAQQVEKVLGCFYTKTLHLI